MNRMIKKTCPLRTAPRLFGLAAAILVGLLIFKGGPWVHAQIGGGYDLTWWTIDGGGVTPIIGGPYTLLSSSGQPDATSNLSGGDYTLQSGFWSNAIINNNVYLPVVIKLGPDLVGSFTLSPAGPNFSAGQPVTINVKITNQGPRPAEGFWVDFYINPSATPRVNKTWHDICSLSTCYGLAWYVSGLGAGQSINLTSNPGSFESGYSNWFGYFTSGTTNLHLLVDSWNPGLDSGAIYELNEQNNLYTLPTGVIVTGQTINLQKDKPELPDRPVRLDK